jgi:hypothetical protein
VSQKHYSAFIEPLLPKTAPAIPISDRQVAPLPNSAVPQRYTQSDSFFSQVAPMGAALAMATAFLTFIPPPALPQKFAQSDSINQVRPTLATLPSGVAADFSPTSGSAQPPEFSRGEFVAPGNPLSAAAAPSWSAAWTANIPPVAQPPDYDRGSFLAPDKSNIYFAPLTISRGPAGAPQGGGSSVPRHFAATMRPLNPQVATPVTLSNWFSTDGEPAIQLTYARGEWIAPANPQFIAPAAATLGAWIAAEGKPAVNQFTCAPGGSTAPDKLISAAAAVPSFAWHSEDIYVPKFDWFSMGDTSTGPSAIARAEQSFAAAIMALNALPQEFAGCSFTAPEKFGITAPAAPVVSGWTSTLGIAAQPLDYDRGNIAAPDKGSQIPPAPPTIASWTSTLGPNAQPPICARGLSSAPEKVLQIVPATPTIDSWTSTLGPNAQPLCYDRGTYAAPDKFGQIVISTVFLPGWSSTDGARAVTCRFAQGENTLAPPDTLDFVFTSAWSANEGAKTIRLSYAQGQISIAPEKFGVAQSVLISIESWLGEVAPPAKKFAFSPGDALAPVATLPAIIASNTLDKWNPAMPAPIYVGRFSAGYSIGPEKVLFLPGTLCSSSGAIRQALVSTSGGIRFALIALSGRVVNC